jgi:hypothetical protein
LGIPFSFRETTLRRAADVPSRTRVVWGPVEGEGAQRVLRRGQRDDEEV